VALDPLRDPIYDRVGHEAGHLAGMKALGYSADVVTFDFRWADFGHFGALDGVRRTTGDPTREPFDRSVIAALGSMLGSESLDDSSAAADRRCIDLWVMPNWPVLAWRMNATEQARRLARTEAFAYTWRTIVVALHDLGERYVELHGDEVDAFLASISDADLLSGVPRPPSASRALLMRQKAADVAVGGPTHPATPTLSEESRV
jgi:hypothetical protein